MAQVKFSYIAQSKFNALEAKDNGTLYFIAETGELYRGSQSFTQASVMVTDFPAAPAKGILYFNTATLEGRVHDGDKWTTVIQAAATAVDESNTTAPVSGKAVADYIKTNVTDLDYVNTVEFNEAGLKLVIDGTKDVPLKGLLKADGVSYVDGTLTLPVANGDNIVLNLPKENFVKSGHYDDATESIVLVLQQPTEDGQEQKVVIPVSKLVDISSVTGSSTLNLSMNGDKVISGSVKISAEGDNLISAKDDGIYVAPVDLSGKVDKVSGDKVDEIVTVAADGNVKPSGLKAGGAAIAVEPGVSTLATEGAVKAYADGVATTLEGKIDTKLDGKVAKADISTAIPADDASDDKVASEKAVADVKTAVEGDLATAKQELEGKIEALGGDSDDKYVAKTDISTAIPEEGAVDTKVASEKAVADVKTKLAEADTALLNLANTINDTKVAKADIVTTIAETATASNTKVASEKSVASVRDDAATNLATAKGELEKADTQLQSNIDDAKKELAEADTQLQTNIDNVKKELQESMTSALEWEVDVVAEA